MFSVFSCKNWKHDKIHINIIDDVYIYMCTRESQVKQLSEAVSSVNATTLITYHIPPTYQMWLVTKHVTSEKSTTSNIKDKKTQKLVDNALTYILQLCKTIKDIRQYPNGIILCSGIVDLKRSYVWRIWTFNDRNSTEEDKVVQLFMWKTIRSW